MLGMNYAKVIHSAWQLLVDVPKLKWFAFVPSFIAVLIFVLEVCWQLYLYFSEFGVLENKVSFELIGTLVGFLFEHHLMLWAILAVIIILFFGFVVPSWMQGVLIASSKFKFENPGQYLSLRQKMLDGFGYFFRIFELRAILGPFEFVSIILFAATFYRYYHDSLFDLILPLLIIHIIISFFIQIFLAFVPYFIVEEDVSLSEAMKKSIGLVFLNFGATLAIILLMVLVNIRIIINVVVILGVPVAIFAAFFYFTSTFVITLTILLGLLAMALAAYLTAIVEVFSTAVWERSYTALKKKRED